LTFHETFENAEENINALANTYVNVINPQVIYARVTNNVDPLDVDACFDIVEVILKVEQLPAIVLDEEYRLCVDENGIPVESESGASSPPLIDTGLDPALFTFVWTVDGAVLPTETGPSVVALAGGVYVVTITEIATGCETTATTTVIVSSPPETYSADVTTNAFDDNDVLEVRVTGPGIYVVSLDDGPLQSELIFNDVSPGNHIITIVDELGCGTVELEVGVIDYPRFITPNQDGFHDTWNIIGIANGDPTAKIYIFDRLGKLLKQLSPTGQGWDGTYNGNPLPSSDYWFRVEYTEDDTRKEFTGHFTLKR
jgi:gliding motility-associated-like protein